MSTTPAEHRHDHLRDVHRGGVPAGERRSRPALPLVWLVQLYQRTVSPLLGPVCRYYPSCSAYSVTALERFGPVRGSWLTARRLLRCNPFARGGVDHVPPRQRPTAGAPHTHAHAEAQPHGDAPTHARLSPAHRRH